MAVCSGKVEASEFKAAGGTPLRELRENSKEPVNATLLFVKVNVTEGCFVKSSPF